MHTRNVCISSNFQKKTNKQMPLGGKCCNFSPYLHFSNDTVSNTLQYICQIDVTRHLAEKIVSLNRVIILNGNFIEGGIFRLLDPKLFPPWQRHAITKGSECIIRCIQLCLYNDLMVRYERPRLNDKCTSGD